MRNYILGFLGTLTCLVAAAFIYPLYSDQRAIAQSANWFIELLPTMQTIEADARQLNSLSGSGRRVGKTAPHLTHVDYFQVEDQGTIILRGSADGQVIVLIPQFDKGNVTWRCIGGSSDAVPHYCRDKGQLIGPFSP